ncbi:MAG: sugar phosphate isomerase/epimerase [Bacteroidetes bacterium]|nr:sugar phosphate isomerase/epimerase [Bacteroidota bacterium]
MNWKTIFLVLTIFSLSNCMSTSENNQGEPVFVAPVGAQAYSFRNYFPEDMIGTLDRIQAMGIKEIEGVPGNVDPVDFRKLCDERGMSIPSTGTDFKGLKEDPMKVVENAKALGAKYVMCAWIPHPNRGNFSVTDADEAIEVFNTAGKILKENGLTFCYHTHGYEFQPYQDGTLMDYIIESTNPEDVSFEMDVFWVQFGGGDPVALLKKYGNRWKLLHLKDMEKGIAKDLTGGTDVEYNVPLGQGQLDMAGILKESRKIGIAHYFIEDESSAVMDQVPQSIAYLKSLKY